MAEPQNYLAYHLKAAQKATELWDKYQQDLKKNPQFKLPEGLELSNYTTVATDKDKETISLIRRNMTLGDVTMQQPRVEFNDLSVLQRGMIDQMSFNTYQPNNGQPNYEDTVNAWRSKALRPVVRNKVISTAAHATARLVFPKVFAFNEDADEQKEAAQVMRDLIEWSANQSDYAQMNLRAIMAALVDPAGIVYTEYSESYRTVKRSKDNDSAEWTSETILDEEFSGFQDVLVPYDQMYIENFYEPEIQKQRFLIWRRVVSYSSSQAKYAGKYENFQYVKPGVQCIYNDANQSFYWVYDSALSGYDVEEVLYWDRNLDLFLICVNGVLLTPNDNPNPREDKKYPFAKFGYELVNNRCFYFKSLAFRLQEDANIINQLYPMMIDGTFMSIFPPMFANGADAITSNVLVPGQVTTTTDPNSDLKPITTNINLTAAQNTLQAVEESLQESASDPVSASGQAQSPSNTAYEIQQIQNNASTILGLFVKMIGSFVRQYGQLRIGDILQYMTLPEVAAIEGVEDLKYKAFLLPDKNTSSGTKGRKISFDLNMPTEGISESDHLKMSYAILTEEMKQKSQVEIMKVNPVLFTNLSYIAQISDDIENPMSDELERAYNLEAYDRLIANPIADQEKVLTDFLLSQYPVSKHDPEKYVSKQATAQPGQPQPPMNMQPPGGQPPMGAQNGLPPVQQQAQQNIKNPVALGTK